MAKDEPEGMTEKRAGFNMACTMMLGALIKQFNDVEKKYNSNIANCCKTEIVDTLFLLSEIVLNWPYDES